MYVNYVCMMSKHGLVNYDYALQLTLLLAEAGAVTKGSRFTVRASTFCKRAVDLVVSHN
jgi:hypothetical protein